MLLVPTLRGFARHLHLVCLAFTAATAAVFAQTNTPTAADGFDPNVDGNVYAMVTQGDGKIIIVGQFANVSPNGGISISRNNIARINPDGTLDDSFNPGTDGPVRAVALQGTQIIIAGDFTKVGGAAHAGIARVNVDGSVDANFTAGVGSSTALPIKPQVLAVVVQSSDNSIVVGGAFGSASSTGRNATRNNLARFDRNGALDLTYDPNPNSTVLSLAQHIDNKIVVGGGFTQFQENGKPTATTRLHIARLNPDGTVDSEFDPKADNGVASIAVQPDGKLVIGGYFTTLQPAADTNTTPVSRPHLARLNPAQGTLDTEFYPTVGGNVYSVAIGPDGGILIGGTFSQIYSRGGVGATRVNVARLNPDSTIDETFAPNVNGQVSSFAIQPDGKVVVGGYFTRAQSPGMLTAAVRNHLARVLPTGALDVAFQLNPGGRILASITQADGKIVVGGTFTSIGGVTRQHLARLNADGSLDASYNPAANGSVYVLAYDAAAKKVLVGGAFTQIGNPASDRLHLARLNNDGTVDSEFNPTIDGPIGSIVIQPDKNILVGGSFTSVHPFGTTDAVLRNYLVRLTDAGQVDTNFNPNPNSSVSGIALEPSGGKIIITGTFTALQPGATGNHYGRNYIARLNSDGTVDTAYNPIADYIVEAVVMQSDGKAVVGGLFHGFYPNGGTYVEQHYAARLNSDGTVDTTFTPNPNNAVFALAVQTVNAKESIVLGGMFTTLKSGDTGWVQAKYVGRVDPTGTPDAAFNLDLNEQPGNRVDSIAVTTNNALLIGGTFTSTQPKGSSSRVLRNHFVRINADGTLDPSFDPGAGGAPTATVNALAVQGDGKIVVGGKFTDLGGATSTNIARFTIEGFQDAAFNSAVSADDAINAIAVRAGGVITTPQLAGFAWLNSNGTVNTAFAPQNASADLQVKLSGRVNGSVIQKDGKIVLVGAFADLTNHTQGNIVRLNPDGSLDTTFNPNVGGAIYGVILEPDTQKLVIYGNFTSVNSNSQYYIARLNPDGTSDTAFNPTPSASIMAAVQTSDGSYIVGGNFASFSGGASSTTSGSTTSTTTTVTTTRNYLAKLTSAGVVDANFNPNLNGAVEALAVDSNGKLIVGGSFTSLQPNSDTTATSRNHLARLSADKGDVDQTWNPNPNDVVNSIIPLDNGRLLIGGNFTGLQPTLNGNQTAFLTHNAIALLNPDGNPDPTYTVALNGPVTWMTRETDGSILAAGGFTTVTSSGSSTAVARNGLVRLDANGIVNGLFNPDFNGSLSSLVLGPNGSILVGGSFTAMQPTGLLLVGGAFKTIGGFPVAYLAEINGEGSINGAFAPAPNGVVNTVLAYADGRFLVGGSFTSIGNAAHNGLARFKSDSSIDGSFNASLPGTVALALAPGGAIVAATTNSVVRFTSTGAPDATFNAVLAGVDVTKLTLKTLAVQRDGKVLVGGSVTTATGAAGVLLRLNADGTVDGTFKAPAQLPTASGQTGSVSALTLQANGQIILSGNFAGGGFPANLARLNSDGSIDASFNPSPDGNVTALALQTDGRLLIGGGFTSVGGLQRNSLARLANQPPAGEAPTGQTLGVSADGKTVTWFRNGAAGEVVDAVFEYSDDRQTWTTLGTAVRATSAANQSNWTLGGLSLPTSTTSFYLRVRGISPATGGRSSSVYELVNVKNLSGIVKTAGTVLAAYTSSSADASHYVWTIDSAGVLRVSDYFTQVDLTPSQIDFVGTGGSETVGASTRLADLATRGPVSPSSPLISGFAVTGSGSRTVLVRAVGPALTKFGVTDYLQVPQLRLYNNATGALVGSNNGWNNDATLAATFARTGAFPFPAGSLDSALVVTLAPGNYSVQVVDGGTASAGGNALVEIYDAGVSSDGAAHLSNLSSRGTISATTSLIGGLVINGTAPKTLLIRGVGPALAKFGVNGPLADAQIAVYDGAGAVVATNDDWGTSSVSTIGNADYTAAIRYAAGRVGAFSFDDGSKDAALVITLPAGAYTVQVSGVNGASGAAMIEVYELP